MDQDASFLPVLFSVYLIDLSIRDEYVFYSLKNHFIIYPRTL